MLGIGKGRYQPSQSRLGNRASVNNTKAVRGLFRAEYPSTSNDNVRDDGKDVQRKLAPFGFFLNNLSFVIGVVSGLALSAGIFAIKDNVKTIGNDLIDLTREFHEFRDDHNKSHPKGDVPNQDHQQTNAEIGKLPETQDTQSDQPRPLLPKGTTKQTDMPPIF